LLLLAHPQVALAQADTQAQSRPQPTEKPTTHQQISAINRSLLLELIKLSRFNIHFHQEANRLQKWRTLSYAAEREAGTAVSFAGSLIDLKQRIRGLDNPARISRNEIKNAITTALVGNAISGTASSLELAQNTWVMLKAREHGYSPRTSLEFVKAIVKNTDTLFSQREQLVATTPPQPEQTQHLYELEARLLRRIRQQLLYEFATWSAHSRARAWRENTFYSIDALQNYTRMSASIIGLKGFGNPHLGGPAAISTLTANCAATLNPIICGIAGRSMRHYQLKKLAKEFSVNQPMLPSKSLAELKLYDKDSLSEREIKLLDEAMFLGDKSERLDITLNRESADIERLRRIAQQQTIAGPLIGFTSVASATLGTVAFYDYRFDRVTTNKLLFAGRISGMTGQAYALIQTPYTIVSGIIKKRQLEQKGEATPQLLAARLKNLDHLEELVKSTFPEATIH
jgi:hypothetical protein